MNQESLIKIEPAESKTILKLDVQSNSDSSSIMVSADKKFNARGMGLFVAGFGLLIGLGAGLSSSVGWGGSFGIGIGASVPLFVAGKRKMKRQGCNEAEQQGQQDEEVPPADV